MKIYIMGEVGVGKSHAIDYLEQKGFPVYKDPVIELSEEFLSGDDSLVIQTAVATSLYNTAVMNGDGVYDSCLIQSLQFVHSNYHLRFINEYHYDMLLRVYGALMEISHTNGDVYIYLDKPKEDIEQQIIKRGRLYEQDNPFIKYTNEWIRENLIEEANKRDFTVRVVDVSENYDQLEELISSLLGGN